MKPKAILVTPSLGMGGAEWWMLTLMKYLRAVEVAGIVCTCHNYNAVIVRELRKLKVPILLPTEAVECDVIIGWGGVNIRRMAGPIDIPIVEVAQGADPGVVYDSAWTATHLAAVSEAAKVMYPLGLRQKVTVIENGSDEDRVSKATQDLREEWGVKPSERVVAQVGRLVDVKRPEMLIKALKHLPENWIAVFAGDGPLRDKCIRLAREARRKVIFTGVRDDIGNIYAAADVMCMPSHSEGLSLAMVEAWLAGVPVAAAGFPSAQNIVQKWGPVITLTDRDPKPKQMAAAIRAADKSDPSLAKHVAHEHYSGTAMAKRWEKFILETVLRTRKRSWIR
tara:strand:+ start:9673 stop:10683 length:1011 start_codon:yes stop_codon:yes gene_type:complete